MSDSDPDQSPTWFDSQSREQTPTISSHHGWPHLNPEAEPEAQAGSTEAVEVDEVDDAVCRVCRCGVEDGALVDPCLCRGTMRYVHEQCLSDWVNVTGKDRCELCKHPLEYDNGKLPARPPG